MKNLSVRLFIHSPNVHSGGGRSLLSALLTAWPTDTTGFVQLDARMSLAALANEQVNIRSVMPTVLQRLRAEWWLSRNVTEKDKVLCFGNLPPLFRLRGQVVVFLQNRYLIDLVSLRSFPWKTRVRLHLERCWFKWRLSHVNVFVVQTPSMLTLLKKSNSIEKQEVLVLPFVSNTLGYRRDVEKNEQHRTMQIFLYVASGDPHKNHRRLVEAWCLLAQDGQYPDLWLTLDADTHVELCTWMAHKATAFKLNIKNLGLQSHAEVLALYTQVDAVIFPSTFESFGIPLIEARQAGLPILAAELDYVRDLIDPEQVFDPTSAVSIVRAVKRFLKINHTPLPLLSARDFISRILNFH